MYPDPITPKSFPDKLMAADYDPFGLMPKAFAPPPRVLLSAPQLERARKHIRTQAWAANSLERLLKNTQIGEPAPEKLPDAVDPACNHRTIGLALRNALACLLTHDARFRERALALFRPLAHAYPEWPFTRGDRRAVNGGLDESRFTITAARTYDLLAATGLADDDDALFRRMLDATAEVSNRCGHRTCGNHHSWNLVANLTAAMALGDRQRVHNSLYGWQEPEGRWRYGLSHQLRHDFLSDGLHWERTYGYHYYTLMGITDACDMLAASGADLWHKELPAQQQNDGTDIHRAYGPLGSKCIKAAFDAPLAAMFPNGDLPMLHDSGLVHVRGIWVWGILYNKAYEAYGDPKYAWLLNRMENDYPAAARKYPELPMPLNTETGDVDFARLRDTKYPAGRLNLTRKTTLSLCGTVEGGCTLFPVHGTALLRADAASGTAPALHLFYGPHSAGHQSPAALHVDLHAGGWRRTDAAVANRGYEDPLYRDWVRTTIAHNTVCVDEKPMFPYDFATESIWECDQWRDSVSDGELLWFQSGREFKGVRALNERVYPGVRLDRTAVVTDALILDVFRVRSPQPHQYDWAVHGIGELTPPAGAEAVALGSQPGYRHLGNPLRLPTSPTAPTSVEWQARGGTTRACIAPPTSDAQFIVARDPVRTELELGEFQPIEPRTTLLVRSRASAVVFIALFGLAGDAAPSLRLLSTGTDGDIELETTVNGRTCRWFLPLAAKPVRCG